MEADKRIDDAFCDRNQAVMLAAKLARMLGYRAGWGMDPDEPEWPVLFIELPTGQVSWHIPMAEVLAQQPIMHNHGREWDGHTVEDKRRRILRFLEG